MEKLIYIYKYVLSFLLEILFPTYCIGCHIKKEILCNNCQNSISFNEKETEKNIYSIYSYNNKLVKKIIWKLKYDHNPQLGRAIGKILYESMLEIIMDLREFSRGQPIIVIPVPISKTKLRIRGYNQAHLIAKGFVLNQNHKLFCLNNNIIKKKRNTIAQAKILNKKRRLNNIKDSFDLVLKKEIKGKTIIIIDDVTTTGGTLLEIIKLLKKSGAKQVVGFTFAH